jgi:hypothetical protein
LIAGGCSLVNEKQVCDDVAPQEAIVNQQQDGNELVEHPHSIAQLADGNVLFTFTGQSIEELPTGFPAQTSVRLARFEKSSGAQRTVCTASLRDRDISDSDTFAYGGSITVVDLNVNGTQAAALVAWSQGVYPNSRVRMRFVDSAGCPLGPGSFDPVGTLSRLATVGWSARRQAALALVDHESEERGKFGISALWVTAPGLAQPIPLVERRTFTSFPVLTIGPNGAIFVAWSERARGVRLMVLDSDGVPLGTDVDSGIPVLHGPASKDISVSLAASDDRVAIVADGSLEAEGSSAVYVREFTRAGQPLGAAWRVDESSVRQFWPSAAYLAAGTLLVAWETDTGTKARLFRDDGTARFSSIACDESPFAVGVASPKLSPSPISAYVGEEAWIFHSAPDPRGVGVWLWREPFSELWPGNQ